MALDLDQIRAAVAERHNVLLGKDDPVLVTATLCDVVLESFLGRIEGAAARLEERGAALMAQELTGVKQAAERLVGGAAGYAAGKVKAQGEETARAIALIVDAKLAAADKELSDAKEVKRMATMAATAAVIAAVLAIGVALGALVK